MHSGTMRQSLIDVTPFMPVTDFICEFCSVVIIREEEAASASAGLSQKVEEHRRFLDAEHDRKVALDEETLEVARDVRVLRSQRKTSEKESEVAWKQLEQRIAERQRVEGRCKELHTQMELGKMDDAATNALRATLEAQLAAARNERDKLKAQLDGRKARAAQTDSDDPVEQVKQVRKNSFTRRSSGINRVLSFSKNKGGGSFRNNTGGDAGGGGGEASSHAEPPKSTFSAPKPPESPPSPPKAGTVLENVGRQLVKRLSFGRSKTKS